MQFHVLPHIIGKTAQKNLVVMIAVQQNNSLKQNLVHSQLKFHTVHYQPKENHHHKHLYLRNHHYHHFVVGKTFFLLPKYMAQSHQQDTC